MTNSVCEELIEFFSCIFPAPSGWGYALEHENWSIKEVIRRWDYPIFSYSAVSLLLKNNIELTLFWSHQRSIFTLVFFDSNECNCLKDIDSVFNAISLRSQS